MGRNLAGIAIIAAGINAFLMVYAVGRLGGDPEFYTGYGAATYFVTLLGIPVIARAMKHSAHQWLYFLGLTALVFGPLVFSMYVNYDQFPFQQTFLAISSVAVFYVYSVYVHLHSA